jgi:quercetin dioxygenase-like cupin family protein
VSSKDLQEIPGKEVVMIAVEYAPGGSALFHRHHAHGFIYVLEGSMSCRSKAEKEGEL